MPAPVIKKRAVFLLGGYCRNPAEKFDGFLREQLRRFARNWGLEQDVARYRLSDDGLLSTTAIDTRAGQWSVQTEFNFCVWEGLVLRDFSRPLSQRLADYAVTLWDYVVSGTLWRMLRANWRMAVYFAFPLTLFAGFAGVAWLLAGIVGGLDLPAAPVLGLLVFVATLWGLLRRFGERWYVTHLMDLWTFSRQYTHDRRADAAALVDRYARAVVERAAVGDLDEIVVVGHSSGSILALDTAARATELAAQTGSPGVPLCVLTVGSTALKVGLHPAGAGFRRRMRRFATRPDVDWVEYQAMTDVINFYKTDPAAVLELPPRTGLAFPQVVRVHIKQMLEPDTYRRIKLNLFRVHYQFIMANNRHYHYDFYMICCGPVPLPTRAHDRVVGPAGDGVWTP